MSLPRDVLLFSTVLMLWAVQIEASGYGQSGTIVLTSLVVGVIGLLGSVVATLRATEPAARADADESSGRPCSLERNPFTPFRWKVE